MFLCQLIKSLKSIGEKIMIKVNFRIAALHIAPA